MCPQENLLYDEERTGIDHIILAEQCPHQRNDQNARIRVDDAGALNHIQPQRTAQQPRQQKKQRVQRNRQRKGVQQSGNNGRRVIHLKGVDDDARHNRIHHHDRQHAAVRTFEQPDLDEHAADQKNEKTARQSAALKIRLICIISLSQQKKEGKVESIPQPVFSPLFI